MAHVSWICWIWPLPLPFTPEVDVFTVKAESLPRLETKILQAECAEVDDEEDQDDCDIFNVGAHCVFHGAELKQLLKQLLRSSSQ